MKYTEIDNLFDKLWLICRSITGPGITEFLKIIQDHVPIDIIEVPTGAKVFNWVVTPEWKLNKATLHTEDGELIVSTKARNIHVLNFSQPFNGEVTYEELEQCIYSNTNLPEAIPYLTSYCARRWGLCISDKQKLSLQRNKKYKVNIDTEIHSSNH
jgi:aminopeptidase-like protein